MEQWNQTHRPPLGPHRLLLSTCLAAQNSPSYLKSERGRDRLKPLDFSYKFHSSPSSSALYWLMSRNFQIWYQYVIFVGGRSMKMIRFISSHHLIMNTGRETLLSLWTAPGKYLSRTDSFTWLSKQSPSYTLVVRLHSITRHPAVA